MTKTNFPALPGTVLRERRNHARTGGAAMAQAPGQASRLLPLSHDLTLAHACVKFMEIRRAHFKPRTIANYLYHFRYLAKFFGEEKRLSTFHEGDFRRYQEWRRSNSSNHKTIGASCINHELGALAQILEMADLWAPIARCYRRFREPGPAVPRVLSAEEEDRFFRVARRRPEWKTALCSALLTAHTTIAGGELRALRLENICLDQDPALIRVTENVKNQHRIRSVPLNDAARQAVFTLIELARSRGACEASHYLIPYRVKSGLYDPSRPASPWFIRSAFRRIARSCGLGWVTPRSLRHQAITKLLERGAPNETVRAIAGHVSQRAMEYYSHIRIEAKKAALDRLQSEEPGTGPGKGPAQFPRVARVEAAARRLGVPVAAALEILLECGWRKTS